MTEQLNAGSVVPGLYDAPPSSEVTRGPHTLEVLAADWTRFKTGRWAWKFRLKATDQQGSLPYNQMIFLAHGMVPEGYTDETLEPSTPEQKTRNADTLSEIKTLYSIFGVELAKDGVPRVKDFVGKRSLRPVVIGSHESEGRVYPETRWTSTVY